MNDLCAHCGADLDDNPYTDAHRWEHADGTPVAFCTYNCADNFDPTED